MTIYKDLKIGSSVNGTSQRYTYNITSSVSSVSGSDANGNTLAYDSGFADVYLNGVRLSGADITITSGNSVSFASNLSNGDVVDIVAYGAFTVASVNADNLTSGTVPDARITGAYTGITNLTMSGDLTVDTNTLFVDSSNNRVGIGNTTMSSFDSEANNLVVGTGTGDEGITIYTGSSAGHYGSIFFADGTSGDAVRRGKIRYEQNNEVMSFSTNTSERMRIDSSGNVLVGKTSTTNSVAGSKLGPGGQIVGTVANDDIMILNRTGTDGKMLRFFKDTADFASIGVNGGNNPYFSGSASNHGGVMFSDAGSGQPTMLPMSGGTTLADNSVNIGVSTLRYKDLYLAGGIYVGGTGTANKLDDYEEGTWTPTLTNETTAVYSNQTGWYRKIGNTVYIYFSLSLSSKGDISGSYTKIGSLPFTGISGGTRFGSGQIHAYRLGSSAHIQGIEFGGGTPTAGWIMTGGGTQAGYLNTSFVANNTFFEGFAMYRTA